MIKKVLWILGTVSYIAMIIEYPAFYLSIRQEIVLTYQLGIYRRDYLYLTVMGILCAFVGELSSRIPEEEKGAAKYLDLIRLLGPILVVAWVWLQNRTYLAVPPELLVFGVLGATGFLAGLAGGRWKAAAGNRLKKKGLL